MDADDEKKNTAPELGTVNIQGNEKQNVDKLLSDEEALDFVSESKEALLSTKTPFANAVLILLGSFIVIAIIWAYFAVLDEMTEGEGKVIPSSQIQEIASLDAGILSEVYVKEGDRVEKGDKVIRLDDTLARSEYYQDIATYYALIGATDRMAAEIKRADKLVFSKELDNYARKDDIIEHERDLFESNREQAKLLKKQLDIASPLAKNDQIPMTEFLDMQLGYNKLKQDNLAKITESKAELEALRYKLVRLKNRLKRTTLRSPMDGIIKQVNLNTVGGVVRAGETIVEIVPVEDNLLIEARIRPQDIAFIHPGQKATVKFTAYDFSIYGGLYGLVEHISADTSKDEKDQVYYEVWIRTDKNFLGSDIKPLPIIPGMVANVSILTGKKSVLDYLMKPILKAKNSALRER